MGGIDNVKDQLEQAAEQPDHVDRIGDGKAGDEAVQRDRRAEHRATGDMYTEILLKGKQPS